MRKAFRTTFVWMLISGIAALAGYSGENSGLKQNWSAAVKLNDAEFQISAPSEWFKPTEGTGTEIQLSLKISNAGKGPIQINVFDTISITLEDGAGKKIQFKRARDATHVPPPLTVAPSKDVVIERIGKLEAGDAAGTFKLSGSDGAGGWWWLDGLKAGKYTISMSLTSTKETCEQLKETPAKNQIADTTSTPFWIGKATTKAMDVEIKDKP